MSWPYRSNCRISNSSSTSIGRILFKYDCRNKSQLNWFRSLGASWKKDPLLEAAKVVPLRLSETSLLFSSNSVCMLSEAEVLLHTTKLWRKKRLVMTLVINIPFNCRLRWLREWKNRSKSLFLSSRFRCLWLSNRAFNEKCLATNTRVFLRN